MVRLSIFLFFLILQWRLYQLITKTFICSILLKTIPLRGMVLTHFTRFSPVLQIDFLPFCKLVKLVRLSFYFYILFIICLTLKLLQVLKTFSLSCCLLRWVLISFSWVGVSAIKHFAFLIFFNQFAPRKMIKATKMQEVVPIVKEKSWRGGGNKRTNFKKTEVGSWCCI